MIGQVEILPEYINYISIKENEVFPALCNIMIAANRYDINVDQILERFEVYLTLKNQTSNIGTISRQINTERYTRLLSELGIYYLNSKITTKVYNIYWKV